LDLNTKSKAREFQKKRQMILHPSFNKKRRNSIFALNFFVTCLKNIFKQRAYPEEGEQ